MVSDRIHKSDLIKIYKFLVLTLTPEELDLIKKNHLGFKEIPSERFEELRVEDVVSGIVQIIGSVWSKSDETAYNTLHIYEEGEAEKVTEPEEVVNKKEQVKQPSRQPPRKKNQNQKTKRAD